MLQRIPAIIAAACLTVYWFWVVVKLVRLGRKLGKDPNAMPREWFGIGMRLLWYPCIGVLLVGLWATATRTPQLLTTYALRSNWACLDWMWMPGAAWWAAVVPATFLCLACTIATFVCWRKMGRSWRIGIDPNEKLELVSTGPYCLVRHPIYALRMLLNVCACIMAPTPLVLIPAAIDILLLQIEARREERYMESKHGAVYQRYKNSVGRFVPRAFLV